METNEEILNVDTAILSVEAAKSELKTRREELLALQGRIVEAIAKIDAELGTKSAPAVPPKTNGAAAEVTKHGTLARILATYKKPPATRREVWEALSKAEQTFFTNLDRFQSVWSYAVNQGLISKKNALTPKGRGLL